MDVQIISILTEHKKQRRHFEYMVRLREQTYICVQILQSGFWIWPQEGFSPELVSQVAPSYDKNLKL